MSPLSSSITFCVLSFASVCVSVLKKWAPEKVAFALETAIDAGYRLFDTAAIYGNEEQVGRGIASKIEDGTVVREDLFITTKTKHEILNIDYLDTWKGLEEAKNLSLAKSIGISNFNEQQLTRFLANSQVKPAVLQIEVNPNLTQKKLVGLAQNNSMVVMAYCPFGAFVGDKAFKSTLAPKVDDPILTAIAKKYGKTTPQIVLRYLVDRGLVPIPKTINKARLEENINIFDFHLTEEGVNKIDEFNRNYRINPESYFSKHPDYPFEKIAEPKSVSWNSSPELGKSCYSI